MSVMGIKTMALNSIDTFGKYIEHKRNEKQITFAVMARELGITGTQMIDLEKGRALPSDNTMLEDIAYLLYLNDEEYATLTRLARLAEMGSEPIVFTNAKKNGRKPAGLASSN